MIFGVLLLLAASSGRLVLMEDTVAVPPRDWEGFHLRITQQPAFVECSFSVESGGPGVRVALMRHDDAERFRAGARHEVLAATGFEKSGRLRYLLEQAGEYSIVVDNRLSGAQEARVHLTVTLAFAGEARELSPARRRAVILLTMCYVAAVVVLAARRLRGLRFRG
ncbi:MAG: hypothetical protein ACM3S5_11045 [Rhodospirillales bacterium]